MDSPGGGRFLAVIGVFNPPLPKMVCSRSGAPSVPLALFCNRDSIICLCCSRTVMLLCNCSCILGSCVWKPGERQANPTSCMPRLALSRVNGADGLEDAPACASFELPVRSSLRGLCRAVTGCSGEDGSFLTMIFGAVWPGLFLSACQQ